MRLSYLVAVVSLLASSALQAQQFTEQPAPRKTGFWKASVVALIAATAADAATSYGRPETNPLLRGQAGQFHVKSIAIKGLITAGALGAQYYFIKKRPESARYAAITNFSMAGMFTGVAVYNHRLTVQDRSRASISPAASPAVSPSFELAPVR